MWGRTACGETALGRVLVHMEALDWVGETDGDIKHWARAARGSKGLSEWTQFTIYNMPGEEMNTWAQDEDEGWVEVWKPRRLLQLRIKFEHCAWLRVVREEAAEQERRRRAVEGAGAWFWAGLMSEDSSDSERWLLDLHESLPRSRTARASSRSRTSRGFVQVPWVSYGQERTSMRGRADEEEFSSGASS